MSINGLGLPTNSTLPSSASPTSMGQSVSLPPPSSTNSSIRQTGSSFAGLKSLRKEVVAKAGGGRGGRSGGGGGKGGRPPGVGEDDNNEIIECQNATITTCTNDASATLSFKSKLLVGAGIAAGLATQVITQVY